ncbi:MAG TPA: hypothetical protein V6C97_05795 [Oculatellaceae cyanobacterium]
MDSTTPYMQLDEAETPVSDQSTQKTPPPPPYKKVIEVITASGIPLVVEEADWKEWLSLPAGCRPKAPVPHKYLDQYYANYKKRGEQAARKKREAREFDMARTQELIAVQLEQERLHEIKKQELIRWRLQVEREDEEERQRAILEAKPVEDEKEFIARYELNMSSNNNMEITE